MKKIKFTKEKFALTLILILSAILNFTNLSIEGYANQYYAAGVKSMTMSLKNFFFVSFDPAGFVSIDKPPLGFWLQAISAKIFGFSGLSILLPEALAGVISVALIYFIVKRSFGNMAGLISALCLAVTPVFVAVSRNNTVDNLLVLTLLIACWSISIAAEKGKLKYLIFSLVMVGIGFNIKMLQAYMIVPAIYLTYLFASAIPVKKRIIHLIVGTLILLTVSFSWAIVVDLIPSSSRPYVGGSTNNTVMELIVGHNGLERLGIGSITTPGGGGGKQENGQAQSQLQEGNQGQRPEGMPNGTPPSGTAPSQGQGGPNMQQAGSNGNGGGNGGTFGGKEKSSILRLFSNNSLSDQIIWLLPLAIFGFAAAVIKEKLNKHFDNKRKQALLLWSMWLLPEFIYFSFTTGLFHPYYLTMLAPPIAALTGIGIVSMWQLYKEGGLKSWILPAALIVDGLVQLLILSYYYNTSSITKILMIIISVLCFGSSVILGILNIIKNKEPNTEAGNIKFKKIALTAAIIGLLTVPTVWSGTTMFYTMSGTFPSAGLELMASKGTDNNTDSTSKLIQYLQVNKKSEKYLVAVPSAMNYASDIIIKTGEPVMTLGGFSGSDNILTLSQFKKLVSEGVVRFAIVDDGGTGGNNEITSWIKSNGKVVSDSEWSGSLSSSDKNSSAIGNVAGGGNSTKLYDLKASIKNN